MLLIIPEHKITISGVSSVALNRPLGCLEPNLPPDSDPIKMIQYANVIIENMVEADDISVKSLLWKNEAFKKLEAAHAKFLE